MFFFCKEESSPSFCMLQKNKTGLAFSCGFVHFGSRGLSGCVTEIHECDGLGKRRKLRATRRNNSQLCRANDVGSCSVRVGSGVQTDATTPNNIQQGVQTDATCNIQRYWELRAMQQCCVRLPGALQGQGRQPRRHFLPVNLLVSYLLRLRRKYPVLLENWDLLGQCLSSGRIWKFSKFSWTDLVRFSFDLKKRFSSEEGSRSGETPTTLWNCVRISKTKKIYISRAYCNLGFPRFRGVLNDVKCLSV